MATDRMIINGREILLARCIKCNVLENINLLDGKDDGSGDFNLLECILKGSDVFSNEWFIYKSGHHVSMMLGSGVPLALSNEFGGKAEEVKILMSRCSTAAELLSVANTYGCKKVRVF